MNKRQMKKAMKKSGVWNVIVPVFEEQGNSHYDPETSNNGGGYDQPYFEFTFNGKKGTYYDSSCGDFGGCYDVTLGNKCAMWGSMYRKSGQVYSDFSRSNKQDMDFVTAFSEWGGFYRFPLKEDFE